MATQVQYGGYDVTPDWKKVMWQDANKQATQTYFNPNNLTQNFSYQGTAPPSALEEYLSNGFEITPQGYQSGVKETGSPQYASQLSQLFTNTNGAYAPTSLFNNNYINNYDQGANEKLLDSITGQNQPTTSTYNPQIAGVAKTRLV